MGAEEVTKGLQRIQRLLIADNPWLLPVEERWRQELDRARIEKMFGTR